MDIVTGIILGAVQGITEFLPISSSGHLILAREVLGLQTEYGLSFDAILHLATALAVLVYFRRDFVRLLKTALDFVSRKPIETKDRNLLFALIIGTIPAVIVGLFLEEYMETTFRSAELVAGTLILGAGIFYLAERLAKQNEAITLKKGLGIGLFQALALIPGMSRSGMTISGGLILGLEREEAARFGFLLAFPIILGAGAKKFLELGSIGAFSEIGTSLIFGALTAFILGILAIHYLLKYLKTHTLGIFIVYRVVLAILVLLFLY